MGQADYLSDDDEFVGVAQANLATGDIVFDAALRAGVITAMTGFKTGQRFAATAKGRFRVRAKTTDTFAADALVYWDAVNREATSTSAGNRVIGRADAAKTNGQTTVDVLLNNHGRSA